MHPHYYNAVEFTDYLNKTVNKINKENKEVYICGDFNFDLLKYDIVNHCQEFCNTMSSNGYLPHITIPTRITDSSMTIIDNIYTNTFSNNIFSGNILAKIADHLSQFISIQRMKPDLYKSKTFKGVYKNFNEDSYLNDLARQCWGSHIPDVNNKYTEFITKLEECTNSHVPIRELSRKEQKIKNKPWITNFILKKITHRNRLFVKKKRNPNNADLKMAYNLFRNSVTRDIKASKRNYYASYFENCKNNMKKTWKGIREIINTKSSMSCISHIYHNGQTITEPITIANTFNNFFTSIGQSINDSIPQTNINPLSYLTNRIDVEVQKIIYSLNNSKYSGPLSIPIKLLKIAAPLIIPPLTDLINLSFETGSFPDEIKVTIVIPVHKAGSKLDINNYRPISLLYYIISVFSKIFEKIMHARLSIFLEEHNIIYTSQFGFQKIILPYIHLLKLLKTSDHVLKTKIMVVEYSLT